MLLNLSIRNIALIESISIDFTSGLGVLTGETGAGKSLLVDSLMFLTGHRVDAGMIKHGALQASIVAEFEMGHHLELEQKFTDYGLEHSQQLLIKRILFKDGKSKAFINDQPVTLIALKEITAYLVEINGQNNQRTLLDSAYHLYLVDSFGELEPASRAVSASYFLLKEKQAELLASQDNLAQIEKEKEYLTHIATELKALAVQPDEEEQLTGKRAAILNQDRLVDFLKSVLLELQGRQPVVTAIGAAERILIRNSAQPTFVELQLQNVIEGLERATHEIDQVISVLQEKIHDVVASPDNLENVEERLFLLRAAARKFQCNIANLPNCLGETYQKLQSLEKMEHKVQGLDQQAADALKDYMQLAAQLSGQRADIASKLEQQVAAELAPLKLEKTVFKVQLEPLTEGVISKCGLEKISFVASTNCGTPLQPLAKIASGGELSRFMLAVRVVLAKVKSIPTIIFDEIDTGIGGAVATALGKRLSLLGQNIQVITITHQPQVTASGDYHLKVSKEHFRDQTVISVKQLDLSEREEEIARMLAGDVITTQAREAAKALLVDAVSKNT